MSQDFETFMTMRKHASDAYINGDGRPLADILTNNDPASFMPPSGTVASGSKTVADAHAEGAKAFQSGSQGRFEILHSGSDGNLGYWTGLQPSNVRLAGKAEPVAMTLRVTEIFRRENGEWKLIHRHADMLKT